MMNSSRTRPSVPGSSNVYYYGGGENRVGAGGAKNHWKRSCYREIRQIRKCSQNIQTFLSVAALMALEEELKQIRRDIIDVSEVRLRCDEQIILKICFILQKTKSNQKDIITIHRIKCKVQNQNYTSKLTN